MPIRDNPWMDPGQMAYQSIPSAEQVWGPPPQTTFGQEPSEGRLRDVPTDAATSLKSLASLVAPNLMEGRRPGLESAMLDVGGLLPFPESGAMHLATPLAGLAGAIKRIGGPLGYQNLESWRGGKHMGTLGFRIPEMPEMPPSFKSVWAKSPLAAGEMFTELKKILGSRMDDLVPGSQMLPTAIPFYESLVRSRHLNDLPNLRSRLQKAIDMDRSFAAPGEIPASTYRANKEKQILNDWSLD